MKMSHVCKIKAIFIILVFIQPLIFADDKINKFSVEVYPSVQRFIGNVCKLDRARYFNTHSAMPGFTTFDTLSPDAELNQRTLKELNMGLGRSFIFLHSQAHYFKQDANRPGYLDMNSARDFAEARLKEVQSSGVTAEFAATEQIIAGYSEDPSWPTIKNVTDVNRNYFPVNYDAAAELTASVLKSLKPGITRPKYFEIFNEPDARAFANATTWPAVIDYHLFMNSRLKKELPDLLTGGPCLCYPMFSKDNFSIWNQGMKYYMDRLAAETDFYSLHLYDVVQSPTSVDNYNGARTEAILDLIEAYSTAISGQVKPLIISEYGATWQNYDQRSQDPNITQHTRTLYQWYTLRGATGKLFTLLDRPDRLLNSIPFLLITATWDNNYPWIMYRKTDGGYQETHLTKFYKLFKDVKGSRILTHSPDQDIQVLAFRDSNTIYLCLNNLDDRKTSVNINMTIPPNNPLLSSTGNIISANIKRLYYDGNEPVFEDVKPNEPSLKKLEMKPYEAVVIEYKTTPMHSVYSKSIETTSYSKKTVQQIEAKPLAYDIELSDRKINEQKQLTGHAWLRVGLGRQHGMSLEPNVIFNGHDIGKITDMAGDSQPDSIEFFGTVTIEVPIEYVKSKNAIELAFPDQSGYVSSMALVTAKTQEPD